MAAATGGWKARLTCWIRGHDWYFNWARVPTDWTCSRCGKVSKDGEAPDGPGNRIS
jgi:hypothetical protein